MLTISKDFGKQKAGATMKNATNVLNYLRLMSGVTAVQVDDDGVMAVVKTVGDHEADIVTALKQAANVIGTDDTEEVEEHSGVDISAANKNSSDLAFAHVVAAKLNGGFTTTMEGIWKADKVSDDAPLDTRDTLKKIFSADDISSMPVIGTYSADAAKKKGGTLPIVSDNQRPQFFCVTEIKDGKSVTVVRDWYQITADDCPIGRVINAKIDGMFKAKENKADAPANYREAFTHDSKEFLAEYRLAEKQRKRVRNLFRAAIEIEQQILRFAELPLVWVAVATTKGPFPIAMGRNEKDANTGALKPVAGANYSISQFLAFDVATAIAKGGTLQDVLNTTKRDPGEGGDKATSIKVENINAFFNALSAMRSFIKRKGEGVVEFETAIAAAIKPDKEGANKTHIRWLGDVYVALAPVWDMCKVQYQQDLDEDHAATEKAAKERLEREAEVRKEVAAKLTAKHNETVIVRKAS